MAVGVSNSVFNDPAAAARYLKAAEEAAKKVCKRRKEKGKSEVGQPVGRRARAASSEEEDNAEEDDTDADWADEDKGESGE